MTKQIDYAKLQALVGSGKSAKEISQEFGISLATTYRKLAKAGLRAASSRRRIEIRRWDLYMAYHNLYFTQAQIAKMVGCSASTISRRIKEGKIKKGECYHLKPADRPYKIGEILDFENGKWISGDYLRRLMPQGLAVVCTARNEFQVVAWKWGEPIFKQV